MIHYVKAFLIWTACFVITGLVLRNVYGEESREAELVSFVDEFHAGMKPRYARKAKELIPYVLKHSEGYGVDPLLVAVIISRESSWRHFDGALGERGPMHVLPSRWSKPYNLETIDGQIEAGCARLRAAMDKCPSLERALTHYACGRCVSKSEITKRKIRSRVRFYQRSVERFRMKQ